MRPVTARLRLGALVLVAVVSVPLAGCGGSDSSKQAASPTPSATSTSAATATGTEQTASAVLCSAARKLKASLTRLADVDVTKGVSALKADLQAVRADLQNLAVLAGAEATPEITALKESLKNLGDTIGKVASPQDLAAALPQIRKDAAAVRTDAAALERTLTKRCA
jgi:hypothetical protein